ncbi:hypothetical protein K6112_00675 [Methylophilales bacterium]|nr:hypothetical protein K6112_00675 [Methylophilales bacterium]
MKINNLYLEKPPKKMNKLKLFFIFIIYSIYFSNVIASSPPSIQISTIPVNFVPSENFSPGLDIAYGFSINKFKGKLFLFVHEVNNSNQIYIFNEDRNMFDLLVDLGVHVDPDFQLRSTFNDNDERLFLVFDTDTKSGKILFTDDLKKFNTFSSNEHGFRSITKYKNTYIAGTADNSSAIFLSDDGFNWKKRKIDTLNSAIVQINGFMIFESYLYIVANSGVFKTKDLKKAQLVFTNPEHTQIYAFNDSANGLLIATGWAGNKENPENTISTLFYSRDGKEFNKIANIQETPMVYTIKPMCNKLGEPVDLLWGGYRGNGVHLFNFEKGISKKILNRKRVSIYSSIEYREKFYFSSYPLDQVISVGFVNSRENCK